MLVTLNEMKNYLGVLLIDTTQDTFLNEQLTYISEVVEAYCGRTFGVKNYRQTIYKSDYSEARKSFLLQQYPVIDVTKLEIDGTVVTDFRIHQNGMLTRELGFFTSEEIIIVEYTAGFATIPSIIKQSVMGIVAQRYNKKVSGVSLDFGSDVQSISIPGVINVVFDYTLDYNQRKSSYGNVVGSFANMLDGQRSERVIIGSGKLEYVEVLP